LPPLVKTATSRIGGVKGNASKAHPRGELLFREVLRPADSIASLGAEEQRGVVRELTKIVPHLSQRCGVAFHGRILEIGAGDAWLSAELSKQPRVVEILSAGLSPKLLEEESPKLCRLLKAHETKITRLPLKSPRLELPDDRFDFVVCTALLHRAMNMVAVLREVRRLLKPGGQFVAVRERVLPLVKWKSAARRTAKPALPGEEYTLADYREFFALAGLELETKRLNLSDGFKYYFDEVINGLTHARYVFVARRPARKSPSARSG
jgi:SAM-dependent methyltransferase